MSDIADLAKGFKLTSSEYPTPTDVRWCPRCREQSVSGGKCFRCRRAWRPCPVCVDGVLEDDGCPFCKERRKR